MNRVFDTGYFSNCQPAAEDTRDGVRVVVEVKANPHLRGVVMSGANVLPVSVVQDAFAGQHGHTLNFRSFGSALQAREAPLANPLCSNSHDRRSVFHIY